MSNRIMERRVFLGAIATFPAAVVVQQQTGTPTSTVGVKVGAGDDRFGRRLKLPDGSPLFIKVSSQDTGGAFFVTEQPSGQKGGPPKHFHLAEDEWFYCLAGDYIVEVGNQRYELKPGDSVLGPRGVPHAFAFVGNTPGRLMVGFTPAGQVEQFFRDLDARGEYFGTGTNDDRDAARERYGIVNVGPPHTAERVGSDSLWVEVFETSHPEDQANQEVMGIQRLARVRRHGAARFLGHFSPSDVRQIVLRTNRPSNLNWKIGGAARI